MDIILHNLKYVNIKKEVVHMEDRCVVCGELIPEGGHVCGRCREDGGQAARNMIRVQGRQIETKKRRKSRFHKSIVKRYTVDEYLRENNKITKIAPF